MKSYYTFGPNHHLDGRSLKEEFVVVEVDDRINVDPRDIVMGWRGSNAFAFEYDESTWTSRAYPLHYRDMEPLVVISVEMRKV